MESDPEMDALVDAILEASVKHGLPAYIETHRATITQDIWRTTELVRRRPDVRFNGDFSHFYCGNEVTYPGFANFRRHYQSILERICFFHGRISNGHSMQVDVGDGRDNPHAMDFQWLWETGMRCWLRAARSPGTSFLSPPNWVRPATTTRSPAGPPRESSPKLPIGRAQSLVIKRLAEESWLAAHKRI